MKHISELLPAVVQPETIAPLTPIQARLRTMPVQDEPDDVLYQHTVLCQTSMPYRDPGDEVRLWERDNGQISLLLQAGQLLDPSTSKFVSLGLPYGPKPRLVLCHLNAEAIRNQSPAIELEDSLTAFVKRTLGLNDGGRSIRSVKGQLNRLAAADFRFGMIQGDRAITVKTPVLTRVELWTPRDARQRVLWPTTVQFSADYFASLMYHAVPLVEGALARLSHSAMALDIYTWLAQRLHRIPPAKPAFVPWAALRQQFGPEHSRMTKFRHNFLIALHQVHRVYRRARFHIDAGGMRLYSSPPPVPPRRVRIPFPST